MSPHRASYKSCTTGTLFVNAKRLPRFIQNRTGTSGLYSSASEYIRDLVRRDDEREERGEEQRKWLWLREELKAGAEADEREFVALGGETTVPAVRMSAPDG